MGEVAPSYPDLLARVDSWFRGVLAAHPGGMQCRSGCFDCCLGLFDVSLADVELLREGLAALDPEVRRGIAERSRTLMEKVYARRPDLRGAASLAALDEAEIDAVVEGVGPERCVCLGAEGQCLVYPHRPIICRLGGAPVVDTSGEVIHPEGCFKNSVTVANVPRMPAEAIRAEERGHLERLEAAGFLGLKAEETLFIPMVVLGAAGSDR